MPLSRTHDLLQKAATAGQALFAFNIITLEYAEAVVDGAQATDSPVVLQISENAVKYHDGRVAPLAAAAAQLAHSSRTPVSLHLDHVTRLDLLYQAAEAGFSSVMFDAAALPHEHNVATTLEAAKWAHAHDLHLEAELGEIGGKRGAHAPGIRTDPAEAAAFVDATGVDSLAVAVGNSHAMTQRDAVLDYELIAALKQSVSLPLVLHGSSGVPDHALRRAVDNGITKINVGTLLNVHYTSALRKGLKDETVVDPRPILRDARTAMSAAVEELCLQVV